MGQLFIPIENNFGFIDLGQLFKIILELKKYLWQKLKLNKTQNLSRTTTNKQVVFSISKVGTNTIAINNHMAIIQI